MVSIPMRWRRPRALPGTLLALLLATQAQSQTPSPTRPDPLDSKAKVPSTRYESSFAQFRRTGDDKPVSWREANDAVARIGGWRVYAREAQQPDPATERPAPPAQVPGASAKPMPSGHPGHKH